MFIKSTNEATEYEAKDQKGRFLGMLLGTLSNSLSWNILVGKEATDTCEFLLVNRQLECDKIVNVAGEGF